MAGDTQGTVKNQMIQEQGRAEMDTGRFSQATKAREMGKPKTGNPPL